MLRFLKRLKEFLICGRSSINKGLNIEEEFSKYLDSIMEAEEGDEVKVPISMDKWKFKNKA